MELLFALLLPLLAGLSTVVGGVSAYILKKPKRSYLAFSLGVAGGVMLYVAFIELLPEAFLRVGDLNTVITFFSGILIIMVIDLLTPEIQNPHHPQTFVTSDGNNQNGKLMRTGILTAIAITIHNFPEGIITFGSTLADIRLGIIIAIAIALHNLPEGLSVAIPIYYATNDKKKGLFYAFISGMAEPAGALMGFFILLPIMSEFVLGGLFGIVAGIMVYLVLDEILPIAHHYGHEHHVLTGLILGMFLIAMTSLVV